MTGPRFVVVDAPEDGVLRGGPLGVVARPDLDALLQLAETAELRGRGGAGFPVARKLRAVAQRRRRPVVVVNAAEGEPASGKDAALLRTNAGLVLDGAEILASALNTKDIRIWGPGHDRGAMAAMSNAIDRRPTRRRAPTVGLIAAPDRFVAGESSAAARGLSGSAALPRTDGRRTSDVGVNGRPTLLLNAETVAQLARLVVGRRVTRLVTVVGAVASPGVVELPGSAPLDAVLRAAGGVTEPVRAFLLGGYHGRWWTPDRAAGVTIGDAAGPAPDCSIVVALPDRACLLGEVEAVASYLADQSARQCGPCAFGVPALARDLELLTVGSRTAATDLVSYRTMLAGRGACHHPDGTLDFVGSALEVLADEVADHAVHGSCGRPRRAVLPLPALLARSADVSSARTVVAGRPA